MFNCIESETRSSCCLCWWRCWIFSTWTMRSNIRWESRHPNWRGHPWPADGGGLSSGSDLNERAHNAWSWLYQHRCPWDNRSCQAPGPRCETILYDLDPQIDIWHLSLSFDRSLSLFMVIFFFVSTRSGWYEDMTCEVRLIPFEIAVLATVIKQDLFSMRMRTTIPCHFFSRSWRQSRPRERKKKRSKNMEGIGRALHECTSISRALPTSLRRFLGSEGMAWTCSSSSAPCLC